MTFTFNLFNIFSVSEVLQRYIKRVTFYIGLYSSVKKIVKVPDLYLVDGSTVFNGTGIGNGTSAGSGFRYTPYAFEFITGDSLATFSFITDLATTGTIIITSSAVSAYYRFTSIFFTGSKSHCGQ